MSSFFSQGCPLSGAGGVHGFAMDLHGPHPAGQAGGDQLHCVSWADGAFDEGAGDHGAEAVHGKDPVDGQAEWGQGAFLSGIQHQAVQGFFQLREPRSGDGGNGKDGLPLQKCAPHQVCRLGADQFQPAVIHQVRLGQHHQPVPDAQQGENIQMLHSLGHDTLVRSDDQQGQVDAPGPGQHVFDELFVARHIHDACLGAVSPVQVGKAQVDGDAPALFLRQTVGVDAGKGLDKHGFAVVYVSGGADDDVLHGRSS